MDFMKAFEQFANELKIKNLKNLKKKVKNNIEDIKDDIEENEKIMEQLRFLVSHTEDHFVDRKQMSEMDRIYQKILKHEVDTGKSNIVFLKAILLEIDQEIEKSIAKQEIEMSEEGGEENDESVS